MDEEQEQEQLTNKESTRQHDDEHDDDQFIQTNPLNDEAAHLSSIEEDYTVYVEKTETTNTYTDVTDSALNQSKEQTTLESVDCAVSDQQQQQLLVSPPPPERKAFAARYLGSVRLPEGDLIGDNSLGAMTQCIICVANAPKKSNKVIHEFKENKKVFLVLEGRELQVITDDKEAKTIVCHPLNRIRAWAVGKEVDSHHFAYVMRSVDDPVGGYSFVCRVFKCIVEGRQVTSALRSICQKRAEAKAATKKLQ